MASYNKVILMGNITADPELKSTQSGTPVTTFTVAVQRRKPKDGSEAKTDFINAVAWQKTAEFVSRYFTKGKPILVEGQLQTRSYEAKDGSKRYVTEVLVDNVAFVSGERRGEANEDGVKPVAEAELDEVGNEEDLPF